MNDVSDGSDHAWEPLIPAGEGDVVAVAHAVATRLRSRDRIEAANRAALAQTEKPESVVWRDSGIAEGYAGLAICDAQLDRCFPGEGWDEVGHQHLTLAVAEIQAIPEYASMPGLFEGLAGVALAAWLLRRDGSRYQHLLASLDQQIVALTAPWLDRLRAQRHGYSCRDYDVILGIAGVGAYLLSRSGTDVPDVRGTLTALAAQLIALTEQDGDVPHWYTPPPLIMQDRWKPLYPQGLFDSGLAHGIAGPLAMLSLLRQQGHHVEGLEAGIERMADWLLFHRLHDEWGVNWGTAYPLTAQDAPATPAHTAWCYGSPGIARALWLAGAAVGREDYQAAAVEAMEAVMRKPASSRGIAGPILCHGVGGLLQITARFARDTRMPVFREGAQRLARELVELYEPDTVLGYRDLDRGKRLDHPGLLNGAAGVTLALLSVAFDQEPVWDRLFLLS